MAVVIDDRLLLDVLAGRAPALAPVMFALRLRRPLNVLTAEALAAALLVGGDLLVTTEAPLLRAGASELGVSYEVLA